MKTNYTSYLAAAFTALVSLPAHAAPPAIQGPFNFQPLTQSVQPGSIADLNSPWVLPQGFEQGILSDESELNVYDGVTYQPNSVDWTDMNMQNETGKFAGRYLYRTHEVRHVAPTAGSGGSLSVIDTWTGEIKVLAQRSDWESLDGNLFGTLSDRSAEGTGIYFGKDPGVLFVNIQHSAIGNDKTMVIYKTGKTTLTTEQP